MTRLLFVVVIETRHDGVLVVSLRLERKVRSEQQHSPHRIHARCMPAVDHEGARFPSDMFIRSVSQAADDPEAFFNTTGHVLEHRIFRQSSQAYHRDLLEQRAFFLDDTVLLLAEESHVGCRSLSRGGASLHAALLETQAL
jgi:hypothetical protein